MVDRVTQFLLATFWETNVSLWLQMDMKEAGMKYGVDYEADTGRENFPSPATGSLIK